MVIFEAIKTRPDCIEVNKILQIITFEIEFLIIYKQKDRLLNNITDERRKSN